MVGLRKRLRYAGDATVVVVSDASTLRWIRFACRVHPRVDPAGARSTPARMPATIRGGLRSVWTVSVDTSGREVGHG
jgi:hypothetical protein